MQQVDIRDIDRFVRFIGDPSDLPYKFSHSLLVLQTPTDGFLSVNEMM